MFRKLRAVLSSLFKSAQIQAALVESPVDLSQAVENPALVKALDLVATDGSNEAKDQLLVELQRANYLAAILTDEMKTTGSVPGQLIVEKGSFIKFLTAESDGKRYLPLFSDWRAIKGYTPLDVTALVLPGREAWSFALQGSTYDGIVINPAHNSLPLDRSMLLYLANSIPA